MNKQKWHTRIPRFPGIKVQSCACLRGGADGQQLRLWIAVRIRAGQEAEEEAEKAYALNHGGGLR